MTARILAALVLAPAPLTLVSPDIDRVASRVLLVVLAVVVFGWVVVQTIGELRFARDYSANVVQAEEATSDV